MRSECLLLCVGFLLVSALAFQSQPKWCQTPRKCKLSSQISRCMTDLSSTQHRTSLLCEKIPSSGSKLSTLKGFVAKSIPRPGLVALSIITAFISKAAHAASSGKSTIKGWDLYGRVPYDDWLFTNEKLLDPNLLKKSIVEAVGIELPYAFTSFQRTKMVNQVILGIQTFFGVAVCLFFAGFLALKAKEQFLHFQSREKEIRGFYTPVSATYKSKGNKGRKISGLDGWIDRSRGLNPPEEDYDDDKYKDDDDDDDDNSDSDKDKGKKKGGGGGGKDGKGGKKK